ncbi:uncharacterized protein LOC117138005 isoform X1 [Drosophila mauritiana]|uniref:Uncharacterized protein LOC117138005 isoform X1 n=1 Tax=Drosophila mauritiana TaxID=7226 RepID=A0A6P8JHG1_DROMA|nr:uncharacterized protein LOC117138005 isoform X1 [Drosophila mauritiana]
MLELNDFTTVCPDDLTAALGFQIYNDLKNEEPGAEFQPHYDPNLKVFYLMKNDKVYVPVLHTKAIDFRIIKSLHEKLKKRSNIFVAIVDNTANILYYQMSEGLSENQSTKTAAK